jgi:small subunit ribosomal protein S3
MGKKINPKILRIGVIRTWPSRWFSVGDKYIQNTKEDVLIRKYLIKQFREAGVDRVEIERNAHKVSIMVYTAKPGLVIGRGGTGAEDLKKKIHVKFLKNYRMGDINLNIHEIDRPNLSAQIVVQAMTIDIEKRVPFRKVMKQAMNRIERGGALGSKVIISGRLNGAEIARTEMLTWGKVPLHTLRADIDYARGTALTTYGTIGIKTWIYKGNKFDRMSDEKGEVVGNKKR